MLHTKPSCIIHGALYGSSSSSGGQIKQKARDETASRNMSGSALQPLILSQTLSWKSNWGLVMVSYDINYAHKLWYCDSSSNVPINVGTFASIHEAAYTHWITVSMISFASAIKGRTMSSLEGKLLVSTFSGIHHETYSDPFVRTLSSSALRRWFRGLGKAQMHFWCELMIQDHCLFTYAYYKYLVSPSWSYARRTDPVQPKMKDRTSIHMHILQTVNWVITPAEFPSVAFPCP
jgi:hypothetical protein